MPVTQALCPPAHQLLLAGVPLSPREVVGCRPRGDVCRSGGVCDSRKEECPPRGGAETSVTVLF